MRVLVQRESATIESLSVFFHIIMHIGGKCFSSTEMERQRERERENGGSDGYTEPSVMEEKEEEEEPTKARKEIITVDMRSTQFLVLLQRYAESD